MFKIALYLFPIIKWCILLLHSLEQDHVNGEDLHDAVLILVLNHTQLLKDNADEIAHVLSQDLFDKVMKAIPNTKKGQQCSNTHILDVNKFFFGILIGTSFVLLIYATIVEHPKTNSQSLKSVLASLRKVLLAKTVEITPHVSNMTQKKISYIQREV